MIREGGVGKRMFDACNTIFMIMIIIVTAYPMYYVIVSSFSDPKTLARTNEVLLWPLKPYTLRAYERVFANPNIVNGYKNTLFVLVFGVGINIVMTCLGAYFLCLKNVRWSVGIMFFIVLTRYFNGGMIPTYLNVRDLGLIDSLWALILPVAINTYNLIIMRTAFKAVPESLIESAKLDGARHSTILIRIMLPLCKATIAVLVLYYGVSHWNSWFNASIYLRRNTLWPLQLVMREILLSTQQSTAVGGAELDELAELAELIKYALIVVGTLPILILYPFLQKYFVHGVMIGAIKG
ncbi:MAG: carbohydrate ABC transporter permease [Christensenellales bacterium]|jgi:putative aldouronate transport system permease protein